MGKKTKEKKKRRLKELLRKLYDSPKKLLKKSKKNTEIIQGDSNLNEWIVRNESRQNGVKKARKRKILPSLN